MTTDNPQQIKDQFSFVTCAVRRQDLLYATVQKDTGKETGEAHFYLVVWHQGNWMHVNGWPWPSVAVDISLTPAVQVAVMGPLGEVLFNGSNDEHDEKISHGADSPQRRGTLRCMRSIDGQLFTAGMDRQVYRRDGHNQWTLLTDPTMWPQKGNAPGFEAIHGFDANNVYAVGWEGGIWHYDGQHWVQIDSPTSNILTDVWCADDGNVYACGRAGLLLRRGRSGQWQILDQHSCNDDLWSVRWFKGRLYLSGIRGVYELVDDQMVPVDFGDDWSQTTYHLSSCEDALVSIGAKDVFIFDGIRWTRVA
jgi:hypothetical protein